MPYQSTNPCGRRYRCGFVAAIVSATFAGAVPAWGQRLDEVTWDERPVRPVLTPDSVHYLEVRQGEGRLRLVFDLSEVAPLDSARVGLYRDSGVAELVSQSYRPVDRLLQAELRIVRPGRFHPAVYLDSLPGLPFPFHLARVPWREHQGRCVPYPGLPSPPEGVVAAWLSPSGRPIRPRAGTWIDRPPLDRDTLLVVESDHPLYDSTLGWRDTLAFCVAEIRLARLSDGRDPVKRLYAGEGEVFTWSSDDRGRLLGFGQHPILSSNGDTVGSLARQVGDEVFVAIRGSAAPSRRLVVQGPNAEPIYFLDVAVSGYPMVDSLVVRQDDFPPQVVHGRFFEVWPGSSVDLTLFGRNLREVEAAWEDDVLPRPGPSASDSILQHRAMAVPRNAAVGRTTSLRVDRIDQILVEARVIDDPRPRPFRLVLAHEDETCATGPAAGRARDQIQEDRDPRILVCRTGSDPISGPQYLVLDAIVTAPWLAQPVVASDSVGFPSAGTSWTEHAFVVDSVRTFEEILGRGAEHVYRDGAAVLVRVSHAADLHRGGTGPPDELTLYNDGWGADATLGAIPGYAYLVEESGGGDERHLTSLGSLEFVWTWYRRGEERWLRLHAGYSHFRDLGSSFDRNGFYGAVSIRPPFPGLQSTVFQLGVGVSTEGEALLMVGPSFGKLGLGSE